MKEKAASLIKGVTLALLYIGVFLGTQTLLGFIATMIAGGDYESTVNKTGWIFIFSAIVALGVYITSFYLRDVSIKSRISIKPTGFVDWVFAFTLAIGCRLLTGVYIFLAQEVPALSRAIESAEESYDFSIMTEVEILVLFASVCFVAPFIEEILFRGIAIKELTNVMGAVPAIILQGVFFGIAHWNLAQSLFTVVVGIILGVVYYKTKNLAVTMLVHMFFNFSSSLQIQNYDMIYQAAFIGIGLTVISLIMIFYINNRKQVIKNQDIGGTYNG